MRCDFIWHIIHILLHHTKHTNTQQREREREQKKRRVKNTSPRNPFRKARKPPKSSFRCKKFVPTSILPHSKGCPGTAAFSQNSKALHAQFAPPTRQRCQARLHIYIITLCLCCSVFLKIRGNNNYGANAKYFRKFLLKQPEGRQGMARGVGGCGWV